jgi:hypothetical protein
MLYNKKNGFPNVRIYPKTNGVIHPYLAPKKLALCYSGIPRDCFKTYYNHIMYFTKWFENYDIDIFFHFWYKDSNENSSDPAMSFKGVHYSKFYNWNNLGSKQEILDLYRPKLYNFEQPICFDTKLIKTRRILTNNVYSMFNSILKCNELKTQYENKYNFIYDTVIRIRTDLICLDTNIQYPINNELYTFKKYSKFKTHDTFAIGDSKNMNIYSEMFNNLEYIQTKYKCNSIPETLLYFWLAENKVKNNQILRYFPLYRMYIDPIKSIFRKPYSVNELGVL